jgi:hypothetical protein
MTDTTNAVPAPAPAAPQADASGTVALSGHEELALSFILKSSYLESLVQDVDSLKGQMRGLARSVLVGGAKRLFLRDGRKSGVSITLPDYSAPGNRLTLSDTKMTKLVKAGDLATLGQQEELFEEEVVDEGGDCVILRGEMLAWWHKHMAAYTERDDVEVKRTERKVVRRLKEGAISILQNMAAQGNELASMLLGFGAKEPMVKAEK